VLFLATATLAACWAFPRARAAWDIHALGSALADYALCMVGPTGPELIRDDNAGFRRLARRRLVAAAPEEAPFSRCAKPAREVSGRDEVEAAHRTAARRFAEYGLDAPGATHLTLDALNVDASLLLEQTKKAWPFVRGSSARLIRPSLGAREAVHPVPPARAVLGRGLPGTRGLPKNSWRSGDNVWLGLGNSAGQSLFVSSDNGVTFRPARSAPGAEERSGRCVGKDPRHGFLLSSASDGSLLLTSSEDERAPDTQVVVRGEHRLLAVACDEEALVVAARSEGASASVLTLCAPGRACAPLAAPSVAPFAPLSSDNFDLARVSGVTVLAVETRGIVRVVSSRDDGVSWTPPSVAFDASEYPELKADVAAPSRLLTIGARVFLYGAVTRSAQSYPLLASDDQGASFRGLALPAARDASGAARVAADSARR
jgi:hypothetical protein